MGNHGSSRPRTSARLRVSSAALAATALTTAAVFGPGAAGAAGPSAKAARTLNLSDSANLVLNNHKGTELKESGTAKGNLPGRIYIQVEAGFAEVGDRQDPGVPKRRLAQRKRKRKLSCRHLFERFVLGYAEHHGWQRALRESERLQTQLQRHRPPSKRRRVGARERQNLLLRARRTFCPEC